MQAQAGGHTIRPPAEHHQNNSANRVRSQNIGPAPGIRPAWTGIACQMTQDVATRAPIPSLSEDRDSRKAERMSINAYKNTIRQSESPRQIERRILSRLTGAIEAHSAYDTADSPNARLGILSGGLRDALAENQTFWNELKYDLAMPENQLSPDLRAGLLSLALWVDRQTTAIMGGKTGVMALVDINRSIVAGLAASPAAPVPATAEPRPVAHVLHQGG